VFDNFQKTDCEQGTAGIERGNFLNEEHEGNSQFNNESEYELSGAKQATTLLSSSCDGHPRGEDTGFEERTLHHNSFNMLRNREFENLVLSTGLSTQWGAVIDYRTFSQK
jgi:hypothetical protein